MFSAGAWASHPQKELNLPGCRSFVVSDEGRLSLGLLPPALGTLPLHASQKTTNIPLLISVPEAGSMEFFRML